MLRKILIASCVALASANAFAQQPAADPAPAAPSAVIEAASEADEAAAIAAEREAFEKTITRRTGKIGVANGQVTLNVPAGFYFLDKADTKRVLEDAWGNPPDDAPQGMLFPDHFSAMDIDSWGVVVTYEETGYVSDADAAAINYDDLLRDMRSGEEEENAQRTREGYPPIHLVGWATKPRYDAATHKFYWALDLTFADNPEHTLNYNMRVLGRKGVLQLNFVAGMSDLATVEQASPAVLSIPEFNPGFRYEEFNAATDAVADYGLAGLIAGGAGLAIAQKTGLLAVILLLVKKFWFLGIAAVLGAGGFIARLFGGKTKTAKAKAAGAPAAGSLDGQLFGDKPPGSPPST
jgi:uncharacterized membrane-anchored protein